MGYDGEALTGADDLDAIKEGLGENPITLPYAAVKAAADWYQPDEDAYKPLDNNEIAGFLLKAEAGEVELEVHGMCEGMPYLASLNTTQVKEAYTTKNMDMVLREHFHTLKESGQLYSKLEQQNRLREARAEFREDSFDGGSDYFGTEPGELGEFSGNREFLPLGNSPFNRQLYIHDQWDMQAKAFYARTHDPVAKRALTLISDFTLGRNVKMVCASSIVQDYLEKFDRRNKLQRMLPTWIEDQGCDGELFMRFFATNEGPPLMKPVDPSSIWEIVTDPEDIDDVKFYWQQYQTAYQLIGNAIGANNIPTEDQRNPTVKYIIRYIPASHILHFKINASAVEKRGRSDLFPVLGWLQRLRKYYDAETVKSLMQAAFVFDIKLLGGASDAAAVKSFSSQVPPPDVTKPGSAFYHNEAVEVQLLQGNKSATTTTGAIGIGDGLLGIIAIGMGFAKDYLGVTSRGSRATALVSTEPSAKHFENRQRSIRYMLEDISEYVIQYGIDKGELPARERIPVKKEWRLVMSKLFTYVRKYKFGKAIQLLTEAATGAVEQPLDRNVTWIFPDIVKADRSDLIDDIKKAEGMNYFSKRRAAEMIAAAFEVDDYDYDEEQQDIEMEGKTVIAKDQEQVPKGLPDPNDPAFAPSDVPNPAKAQKTGDNKTPPMKGGDDNPHGNGGSDIRKDLGPQNKESIRITIK